MVVARITGLNRASPVRWPSAECDAKACALLLDRRHLACAHVTELDSG